MRAWFLWLSTMRRALCQWTPLIFRISLDQFRHPVRPHPYRFVDECCSDYPVERRARHIIDDRALSSVPVSLILPVGIRRLLSLLGEIEIEYKSTKGMQKEEKRTRIRKIRTQVWRFKKKKKKGVKTYERWEKDGYS